MHTLLGSVALVALLLSAVASLLTHLMSKERRARLLKVRRALGLFGFGIAFAHATSSLLHVHVASFAGVWNRLHSLGYMQHGALALTVLFALSLTSFPRLNAKLGLRTWAALHRLAYVALLLAALHALEAPNLNPRVALAAFVLSIAVVLARVALALLRRLRPKSADDAPTA